MNNKALLGIGVIIFIGVIGALTYSRVISTPAQVAQKRIYHVGVLSGLDYFTPAIRSFKAKMSELGYKEGENIIYEVETSQIDPAAYDRIARKFVDEHVDLIFVFPTEASLAVKEAIAGTNIPAVFLANIEGVGLIDNISAPGNNLTGISFAGPDVTVKRLELLHELDPGAKRIFAPYFKDYPIVAPELETLRPAAAKMGVTIIEFPATNAAEVEQKLSTFSGKESIDAILMLVEPLTINPEVFTVLGAYAEKHKIPFGGLTVTMGKYSTAFGAFPKSVTAGEQAAILADKIFGGMPAGTIPVVTIEPFTQLNLPVVQSLHLNTSELMLSKFDEIIQN